MNLNELVYFDGVALQSISGVIVDGVYSFNSANRNVEKSVIISGNASTVTSTEFTGRVINIKGIIARVCRKDLDESIDGLKGLLTKQTAVLKTVMVDEYRLFRKCTVENLVISDVMGGTADFDIEIFSQEPYSYLDDMIRPLSVGIITATDELSLSFDYGNIKQAPLITFNIGTVSTPLANRTITIGNPASGHSISIQRTWQEDELVLLDFDKKRITINNAEIYDYSGRMLEWDIGAGQIDWTDDFTDRDITIDVEYRPRFI